MPDASDPQNGAKSRLVSYLAQFVVLYPAVNVVGAYPITASGPRDSRYSVEASRGDAAPATWIFRGDKPPASGTSQKSTRYS